MNTILTVLGVLSCLVLIGCADSDTTSDPTPAPCDPAVCIAACMLVPQSPAFSPTPDACARLCACAEGTGPCPAN